MKAGSKRGRDGKRIGGTGWRGEKVSQNKGGEAQAKIDDEKEEGGDLKSDGGVIERQVQIKPDAGRAWMIKPGA